MSEAISMAVPDEMKAAISDFVREIVHREMEQAWAHLAETTLETRSHTKELVNERIRMIAHTADRAIADARSERLLMSLMDKFKLIDSFQRSLG